MSARTDAAAGGLVRSALRTAAPLLFAALIAPGAALPAQDEAAAPAVITTPDGSRFVLLPNAGEPLVHWAIATLADDPPGFAGLSLAAARAALAGTWRSGSRDPARETQVIDDLDAAYQIWLADRSPEHTAEVARLSALADELGDPAAHARALASVPLHDPEVVDRSPVLVHVTTTVPAALAEAAERMLERREHTALRGLQLQWVETVVQRANRRLESGVDALRAEALALAMPEHPFRRELEPPTQAAPTRAAALRTWLATQHPERTVHVLYGGFDRDATAELLQRTFARTDLPRAEPLPRLVARPLATSRRSVVPARGKPMVALAFALPPDVDPAVLDIAVRWFGQGPDSRLAQELPRRGRATAVPACTAPWPKTIGGSSLLLVEVADPAGVDGLVELLLRTAREIAAAAPTAAALEHALAAAQHDWTANGNDPRRYVAAMAEAALLWPRHAPRAGPPQKVDGPAMTQLLQQVFAAQPVVVEARS